MQARQNTPTRFPITAEGSVRRLIKRLVAGRGAAACISECRLASRRRLVMRGRALGVRLTALLVPLVYNPPGC